LKIKEVINLACRSLTRIKHFPPSKEKLQIFFNEQPTRGAETLLNHGVVLFYSMAKPAAFHQRKRK